MFTIRRANEEDCEAIWRAHVAAIEGTCASYYSPEVIRAWVGRTKPENYEQAIRSLDFFVAEEEDIVLGFGVLSIKDREVQGLYVSPSAGRRGVGAELMRVLESEARRSGAESLQLFSSLNAVAFYESVGYESREELMHEIGPGIKRGCVRMEKQLAAGTPANKSFEPTAS